MEPKSLTRPARVATLAAAFGSILVVGYVDGQSSAYIAFSIFYVVPIFIVSWWGNRILAVVAAALCALAGLAADAWSIGAEPIYRYVNLGARLVLFMVVALTFCRLHTSLARERGLARRQEALAEKERELRTLQEALMKSVVEGAREPLGSIYAKVVDLGFDGQAMSQDDAQQLLHDLADASLKVSKLIGSLEVKDSSDPLPTSVAVVP